jgi:hypothetical protein
MIAVVRYNLKTYGRHFTLLHNHGMSSHQNYLNVLRGYYYFSEKFLIQGDRLGLWLAEICTGIIYQELLHTKSPDLTEYLTTAIILRFLIYVRYNNFENDNTMAFHLGNQCLSSLMRVWISNKARCTPLYDQIKCVSDLRQVGGFLIRLCSLVPKSFTAVHCIT